MITYKYRFKVGDLVIPGPEIMLQENYGHTMSQYVGKLLEVVEVNSYGYLMQHVATKFRTGLLWDDAGLQLVSAYEPNELKKGTRVDDTRRMFKYVRGKFSCLVVLDFDLTSTFHEVSCPALTSKQLAEQFLQDAEEATLKKVFDEQIKNSGGV